MELVVAVPPEPEAGHGVLCSFWLTRAISCEFLVLTPYPHLPVHLQAPPVVLSDDAPCRGSCESKVPTIRRYRAVQWSGFRLSVSKMKGLAIRHGSHRASSRYTCKTRQPCSSSLVVPGGGCDDCRGGAVARAARCRASFANHVQIVKSGRGSRCAYCTMPAEDLITKELLPGRACVATFMECDNVACQSCDSWLPATKLPVC